MFLPVEIKGMGAAIFNSFELTVQIGGMAGLLECGKKRKKTTFPALLAPESEKRTEPV